MVATHTGDVIPGRLKICRFTTPIFIEKRNRLF